MPCDQNELFERIESLKDAIECLYGNIEEMKEILEELNKKVDYLTE